jgi:hypothetical protein
VRVSVRLELELERCRLPGVGVGDALDVLDDAGASAGIITDVGHPSQLIRHPSAVCGCQTALSAAAAASSQLRSAD